MVRTYRKSRSGAPAGFFECEGLGLRWLGKAQQVGGPRVVDVYDWGDDYLDIEAIDSTSPSGGAAYRFGAQLARMHDAGAEYFGSAPEGYKGVCYFGPMQDPLPMATGTWADPIQYWGQGRLEPMVSMAEQRQALNKNDMEMTQEVIQALPELMGGAAHDKPARIHGDLWSGNVMWTKSGGKTEAVLIDPAAHGGHREEDLAMLHLFGIAYLDQILDGYQSVHTLARGYENRLTLWQLYAIAGHCAFFGGGYVSEYRSMCRSLLG